MKAPTLQTPRLSLRAHRLQDFEDYARIWADPGVCRHIGGKVRTREESWIRFLRHFGMWQVVGYGFWAIEEKATGLFLGEAGFLRRDATPTDPEAGWALLPEAQGRGFATEALAAILTWGDRHLGGRKQVCVIEPGNVSSLRVAAKCGFVPAGSATKDGSSSGARSHIGRGSRVARRRQEPAHLLWSGPEAAVLGYPASPIMLT